MIQFRYILLLVFIVFWMDKGIAQKPKSKQLPPTEIRKVETPIEQPTVPQLTPEDKAAEEKLLNPNFEEQPNLKSFVFGEQDFLKDKIPFQIVAFEFPYAIVAKSQWSKRIQLIKAMGFNTLSLPVAWGFHQPEPDNIDFYSDEHNLNELLQLAKNEGLYVILQIGTHLSEQHPYRGMPWWISQQNLRFDEKDKKLNSFIEKYYHALFQSIGKMEYKYGGNVVCYQLENQTGSCEASAKQLERLKNTLLKIGFDPNFISTDKASNLKNNSVFGILPTVENGYDSKMIRDSVSKYNFDSGPYFSHLDLKQWSGDFDGFLAKLDHLLNNKVSISIKNATYYKDSDVWTNHSLSKKSKVFELFGESGLTNENYFKIKSLLKKYNFVNTAEVPKPSTVFKLNVELSNRQNIYDFLQTPIFGKKSKSHEELGQPSGFVFYQSKLPNTIKGKRLLKIKGLESKAFVFVNKKYGGFLDKEKQLDSLWLELTDSVTTLEMVTFNRLSSSSCWNSVVNSGATQIWLDTFPISNWQHYTSKNMANNILKTNALVQKNIPTFLSGKFNVKTPEDTYLDMRGWNQGVVWLNKKLLGYFEKTASVQSLYIPAYLLKSGKNEIEIFDALWEGQTQLFSLASPIFSND